MNRAKIRSGRDFHFKREAFLPYLLMLPTFILLSITLIIPIIVSFRISFSSYNLARGGRLIFIGLENYISALKNPTFWEAMRATMTFMIPSVLIEFVLGTAIALVLNREFRGKNIIRTLFILPMMLTPVVVGLQWRWLYSADYGLFNYFLGLFGVKGRPWLADLKTVFPAIILSDVWNQTPFVILLMLAGLQSLPNELFEAAKIDGASRFQEFIHITLPSLKPIILIVLIMRSIFAFRIFDKIFVLTMGGPANYTQTIAFYAYKEGFEYWHMGFASALSFIMLFILAIMGSIYVKLLRSGE